MYRVELYCRIRRACHVEGMSIREAARLFGLHRDTVRKMLRYSVAPGYQRRGLPRRPKLDPFKGVIDQDPPRRPGGFEEAATHSQADIRAFAR